MKLDPDAILNELKRELPARHHGDLVVVGSLAAACHFKTALRGRAINTKDADFVLRPIGSATACREIIQALLEKKWLHRRQFGPPGATRSSGNLPHIKLYSPQHAEFWIEFQGTPKKDQEIPRDDRPVRLLDGWYAIPCYRFMGVTAVDPRTSKSGLRVAVPAMMALSNLLSHREVGTQVMSTPMEGRPILRAAKDLGRVIALAQLSGRDETQRWPRVWRRGLKRCFPKSWPALAPEVDAGLRDLLSKPGALEEAVHAVRTIGLLHDMEVSPESFRAVADRLQIDAIDPFKRLARP